MKTRLAVPLLAVLGVPLWRSPAPPADAPPRQESARAQEAAKVFESFDFDAISRDLAGAGGAWKAFLDNKTLTAGIYRLKKGGTDGQSPHTMDEVYYVVEGKGRFRCEEEEVAVRPGSVLFVAAHAEHRFLAIEEDLTLLVFFSKVPVEPPHDDDDQPPQDGDDGEEARGS